MDMIERTTATEYKFKGRILNTRVDNVLLPDGSESKREIIEHSGGVGVIALTDDNCICLVRQYRHPYGEVIYEIPAGKRETGEEPLTCGKRELSEEAGYTAEKWQSLGVIYPTPAYCNEKIYVFLATKLKKGNIHLDQGEFVESVTLPLEECVKMVMSGEIKDAKTQIAILKVLAMKEAEQL